MPKQRALILLVLADVVLVTLTIVAELVFNRTLPRALRDYQLASSTPPWSLTDIALFGVWLIIAATTIVAWLGLLLHWKHGPALYAGAWALMLVLVLLSGPSVMTGPGAMLFTLESLIGGMILGLVYFSELRLQFQSDMA